MSAYDYLFSRIPKPEQRPDDFLSLYPSIIVSHLGIKWVDAVAATLYGVASPLVRKAMAAALATSMCDESWSTNPTPWPERNDESAILEFIRLVELRRHPKPSPTLKEDAVISAGTTQQYEFCSLDPSAAAALPDEPSEMCPALMTGSGMASVIGLRAYDAASTERPFVITADEFRAMYTVPRSEAATYGEKFEQAALDRYHKILLGIAANNNTEEVDVVTDFSRLVEPRIPIIPPRNKLPWQPPRDQEELRKLELLAGVMWSPPLQLEGRTYADAMNVAAALDMKGPTEEPWFFMFRTALLSAMYPTYYDFLRRNENVVSAATEQSPAVIPEREVQRRINEDLLMPADRYKSRRGRRRK